MLLLLLTRHCCWNASGGRDCVLSRGKLSKLHEFPRELSLSRRCRRVNQHRRWTPSLISPESGKRLIRIMIKTSFPVRRVPLLHYVCVLCDTNLRELDEKWENSGHVAAHEHNYAEQEQHEAPVHRAAGFDWHCWAIESAVNGRKYESVERDCIGFKLFCMDYTPSSDSN